MSTSPPSDQEKDKLKTDSSSGSVESHSTPKKHGFLAMFKWNRKDKDTNDKSGPDVIVDSNKEEDFPPVSFFTLFRFSTNTERCLDVIGLIASMASGSTQPLMTLLFANLSQSFVTFGTAVGLSSLDPDNPAAQQQLAQAAADLRHTAARNAMYLTFLGLGLFLCTYIFMHSWTYTGERNAKRIRERYLRAVLKQEVAFFDKVGAGEVATRIENDTHLVQQAISEKVPLSVSYISSFITAFILAYARSWRLALALTSIFPWLMITGALMMGTLSKENTVSLKHVAEGGTLAEEVISTIRTAKAFGTQNMLARKYENHVIQARSADVRGALYTGIGIGACFFAIYASYGLAYSFGTTLVNQGRANVGIVINVSLSILMGSLSLALLAPEIQVITKGRAAAAKLFATINRVPEIDSSDPKGLKPEKVTGNITLDSVNFQYPSRPGVEVLKNLSMTFSAGKTSAIVGASGSGKSTIVALIERFYDPISGSVELDGVDIKELNIKWLRSQIGFVMQEPVLFSTTVRENVAQGLINSPWEHASDEEKFTLIKDACVKANADSFISKLPQGYDTIVGERGILLSGGQKQRVAIARAIVSDPRILLFDEATSALDTQSEGLVQDALDKAAAGRTTITIAHRLSTIKDADRIFVMGEGVLIEQGTHDELLQNEEGAYARLVRAQNLRGGAYTIKDSPASKDEKILEEAPEDKLIGRQRKATFSSEIHGQAVREAMDKSDSGYSTWCLVKRMAKLNSESKLEYVVGCLFSAIIGLTHPAYAFVWAKTLDGFSSSDNRQRRHSGDRAALWFFIIAIVSTIAVTLQQWLMIKAATNLTCKLRALSFRAILRQDIKFFDKSENNTGTLTSNLSGNPTKIGGLAGATLGAIVQSITTLFSGIALGLAFSWKLSLIGMACIPTIIWAGFAHMWIVVLKDQKNKKAHEHAAHLACEAASSIRTVAALTREDHCCLMYSKNLETPLKNATRAAFRGGIIYGLAQATTFWVISLIFWYGSRLVSRFEMSPFEFFVSLMGVAFGSIQAGNIFAFVPDVSKARGAASAIVKLFDSVPEIDADSETGKDPDTEGHIRGRLHLEDVHFRYPTRPEVPVLRGMSIKVEPGTYVALAGASGSGKSTIIQMAERFYDPWSGMIYLDGQPIPELNVQKYRKQLALVSQEPTLYAGTVRFNVLLGAIKPEAEVTQEEIELACRQANILDFIQSLPDGFETEVGGKGSQLSGGQKQRIAIARALIRNPKVLLLDEATSALDSGAERVVQEALDQAAEGRTTIAIAHRLSTIQNANCIYFIKDGGVSESGTHDQLVAQRGDYYEYCQLQALQG